MNILTPNDEIPNQLGRSIFLIGPTPRSNKVRSWRIDAIKLLKNLNFEGTVLVPEIIGSEEWNPVYKEQIDWELKGLESSMVLAAWVPRSIEGGMPAFTTNVEFGMFLSDERLIYGRPDWAEKCRYLDYVYKRAQRQEPVSDLVKLMKLARNRVDYFEDERFAWEERAGEPRA